MILLILPLSFIFSCAPRGTIKGESKSGFNPLLSVIDIYREKLNHLAAVKVSECPMYPSCSTYSMECFKKHGFLTGWVMTCDRLMRCGRDELKISPQVIINRQWKCYDPVENNDFWWYKKQSE
ncbi:MAG: membrane protein insertion efficiency factor YidD [Thermodesulfobacteriota bacterium]|nr:membrane protein insertion efficiency factor YidD [Thermodesulfobacteriota bacterium]